MKYKYRIKIRIYHENCTRYEVQIKGLFFWFTPDYVGGELNCSEDIHGALKLIKSNEINYLTNQLFDFYKRVYKEQSKIIQ